MKRNPWETIKIGTFVLTKVLRKINLTLGTTFYKNPPKLPSIIVIFFGFHYTDTLLTSVFNSYLKCRLKNRLTFKFSAMSSLPDLFASVTRVNWIYINSVLFFWSILSQDEGNSKQESGWNRPQNSDITFTWLRNITKWE